MFLGGCEWFASCSGDRPGNAEAKADVEAKFKAEIKPNVGAGVEADAMGLAVRGGERALVLHLFSFVLNDRGKLEPCDNFLWKRQHHKKTGKKQLIPI
jgi:hypothetical protein